MKLAAARKKKIIAAVVSAAVIISVAAVCIVKFVIIPETNYNNAVSMLEQGDYVMIAAAFSDFDEYKDSAEQYKKIKYVTTSYDEKSEFISAGNEYTAGL